MSPQHRPHICLSAAISVDGCIDDTSGRRLILSNAEDLDAVDALRASCDAILVGAGTIRADDPRLVLRSKERRKARAARGLPPDPIKVTLTRSGSLDAGAQFFRVGPAEKLVYCPGEREASLRTSLSGIATVIAAGEGTVSLVQVVADLFARSVRRLLIEGGTSINTQFLSAGLVDEMRLAVAPFFVGEEGAPRLVGPARFPCRHDRPMTLEKIERLGDIAVLWCRPSP
jgi:5-amino-6-(5-phosphoribosylamino)uracil reductase